MLAAAMVPTAQPSPQPQSPPQGPTFRVEVSYVEIDAVVTDAEGKFVRGLTKDDFEILEDGKPQSVTAFAFPPATTVTVANTRSAGHEMQKYSVGKSRNRSLCSR